MNDLETFTSVWTYLWKEHNCFFLPSQWSLTSPGGGCGRRYREVAQTSSGGGVGGGIGRWLRPPQEVGWEEV